MFKSVSRSDIIGVRKLIYDNGKRLLPDTVKDIIKTFLRTNHFDHILDTILTIKSCEKIYEMALEFPPDHDCFKDAMDVLIPITYKVQHEFSLRDGMILSIRRASINTCNKKSDVGLFTSSHLEFSDKRPFCQGGDYEFKYRHEVEYNYNHVQITVGGMITDGENLILLKNFSNNRLGNLYTLIQGHVDFNSSAYTLSERDFLYMNMRKEFTEEIRLRDTHRNEDLFDYFNIDKEPEYYISMDTNLISMEHFGVIYVITVKDCIDVIDKITSNEVDKHKVVLIPKDKIKEKIHKFDDWAAEVVRKHLELN